MQICNLVGCIQHPQVWKEKEISSKAFIFNAYTIDRVASCTLMGHFPMTMPCWTTIIMVASIGYHHIFNGRDCCGRNSWMEPRSELREQLKVQDETEEELRGFLTLR